MKIDRIILLARPMDVPHLPDIERRASQLFRQVPVIGDLPLYLTPARDFAIAQQEGRVWVARGAGETPVGFALVERVSGEWHLEEMDVLPEHGRRGLGSALVRTVCEWVVAQGERSLTLCTFSEVPWNAPFYARMGFRPLAATELSEGLRERMAAEAERGLPPEYRVAMRWTDS